MKKQLDIFFTAVMFLTRLPVPGRIDHSPAMLQKSARYFSWIGILVGIIVAVCFICCKQLFSSSLAILLSMIVSILTTGAFHEDGFADVCDGFGGGWTKEKILLIMKDSRLGTFGVIGLGSMLAAKFMLLKDLPKFTPVSLADAGHPLLNYRIFIGIVLTAHSLSRLMGV